MKSEDQVFEQEAARKQNNSQRSHGESYDKVVL